MNSDSNVNLFIGLGLVITVSSTMVLVVNSSYLHSFAKNLKAVILNQSNVVSKSAQQTQSNVQALNESVSTLNETTSNSMQQFESNSRDIINNNIQQFENSSKTLRDIVNNSIEQFQNTSQVLREAAGIQHNQLLSTLSSNHSQLINNHNQLLNRYTDLNGTMTQLNINLSAEINNLLVVRDEVRNLANFSVRNDAVLDRVSSTIDRLTQSTIDIGATTTTEVNRIINTQTDLTTASNSLRNDAKEIKEIAEALQNSRFVDDQGQLVQTIYKSIETSLDKFFSTELKEALTNFYSEKLNLTKRLENLNFNVNLPEGIEISPDAVLSVANQNSDLIKSAYNLIKTSKPELVNVDDQSLLIKPVMTAGLIALNVDLDPDTIEAMSEFVGQCVNCIKIRSFVTSGELTE
jgi:hypothetical protein